MRETVIVDAIRTPIGRHYGSLSDIHPVDLLAGIFNALVTRNHIDPSLVDDIIVGCVDQTGEQALNIARNAWLTGGLPESVPGTTVDRQCGSSLQAVHFAAQGVMAGVYDMAIAGGVEVMSRVPMGATLKQGPGIPKTQSLRDRYQLDRPWFDQAVGAELIAHQWNLSREELDAFSLTSHRRATQARETGKFDQEIVPVTIPGLDECILEQDECIRTDTTLEKMAALKPAYSGLELLTAGNSSQICDAASAVLIMTPELAHALGIRPRARFVSFSVVGVDPVTMLTGPILATQKILTRSGLTVDDIGLFEVNEAFASVVLAWQREIHAPWNKINVNGGAIALGHPLGATGTRIIATLLNALEDRGQRYGLATICEGGGLANATLIERL